MRNFDDFANDPGLHTWLATKCREMLDELVEKDNRFAVVVCPDSENESWEPEVCVIDLTDDESTDQPYVIIFNHSVFGDDFDGYPADTEKLVAKCQAVDFSDVLRRIDAQISWYY